MASPSQLSAIPLFESLTIADLSELAPWFDVQIASEGVRLSGEGSSGYSFFILTQGSAAVTTNEGAHADLGPGDFFGEMALLDNEGRSATVKADTDVTLATIPEWNFKPFLKEHPEVAYRLLQTLSRRIRQAEAD